jgi:uncharacterized membrane protein YkvA (DUF1232 family)
MKPKKFLTLNPFRLYSLMFRNTKTRWVAIVFTVVYIISPVDLLPEAFLLVFGGVDDLIIFLMFAIEMVRMLVFKHKQPKNGTNIIDAVDLNEKE